MDRPPSEFPQPAPATGTEAADGRAADLNIPLSSQAVFWRPRHLAPSRMLGQIPYLFWLMETIRPRSVVQVGLGDGVVYMAVCQAIERLGARASVIGLQSRPPVMPEPLLVQHDAQYTDFSVLLARDPQEALLQLETGIDLLILNGVPEAGLDSGTLPESWLARLSDRAVILICDPERTLLQAPLRKALVAGRDGITIAGPTSPGREQLDVILHGETQSERLRVLAGSGSGSGRSAHLAARQVFNRLGEMLEESVRAREGGSGEAARGTAGETAGQTGRVALHDRLEQATQALAEQEAARAEERARLQAAEAALAAAQADLVASEARRLGLSPRISELESETGRQARELALLRAALDTAEAAGEAARAEKAALGDDLARMTRQHEERLKDIATLTEQAALARARDEAVWRQRISALEAEAARTRTAQEARIGELEAEKARLEQQLAALREARDQDIRAFLESTSWRVTRPLRSLKQSLGGRRGD